MPTATALDATSGQLANVTLGYSASESKSHRGPTHVFLLCRNCAMTNRPAELSRT